jgi:hypothetical protein
MYQSEIQPSTCCQMMSELPSLSKSAGIGDFGAGDGPGAGAGGGGGDGEVGEYVTSADNGLTRPAEL